MARVYIHEFVDVLGTRRRDYQHHMTANWVPAAGPLRRQRCFGVFSLVGSTGRWPQVVNIWEYDHWDDLAHNFAVELDPPGHRDPMLERWWAEAAQFRTGGLDRILVEHPANPGVEHWQGLGGTSAVAYLHEILTCAPGEAAALADSVVAGTSPAVEPYRVDLVGLWRTAMAAEDEVIVLWALPSWEAWAALESDDVLPNPGVRPMLRGRDAVLLVDAELSPLRIGRQPAESDRRPLT